ncbi:MAG: ribosome small subunit-dependent GTPase A [Flavobacteriales bacterium]|nr:ribosome small subunit-dependent GTPase A [Flavobacteriales bacterium]
MKGLVIKSTGAWYEVLDEAGTEWTCRMRGKFRMKGLRTTNPISVGDRVVFEEDTEGEDSGIITKIEPRKNYIIRKSVNLSKEAHIVASNVDQAFLFITLKMPRTSTGFVDRFLVTAEAYNVKTILVFNKLDLMNDKELATIADWTDIYTRIGYAVYEISATEGNGAQEVYELMSDKVNLLSGHSGVGKSTFINTVNPGLALKTSEISDFHQKGKHTTTFAEMHQLKNNGFIIDTPGIKGFGLVDIPKNELHHHFPEMFELLPECKFHNCIHINEPGCAVRKAVEDGNVAESRYKNYLAMYEHDEGETYRVGY